MATVPTAAAGRGPHPNSDAPHPGSCRPGALIRRLPTALNRAKEDRRGALAALGGLVKSPNGAQPAGNACAACGKGEGRCGAPLGPLARQPARTLDHPPNAPPPDPLGASCPVEATSGPRETEATGPRRGSRSPVRVVPRDAAAWSQTRGLHSRADGTPRVPLPRPGPGNPAPPTSPKSSLIKTEASVHASARPEPGIRSSRFEPQGKRNTGATLDTDFIV